MLTNYLRILLRNLRKYPFHYLINITGLTVGMAGAMLIFLFVWDERQFDANHPEGDRIYRMYDEWEEQGNVIFRAVTPAVFAPTLQQNFPEVEQTLTVMFVYGEQMFHAGSERRLENKGLYAEQAIFDFFDLPLLEGDPAGALDEPNEIVLTRQLAEKYFGDEPAVGKTIQMDTAGMVVTAVLGDLPRHFHLDIHFLVSFETVRQRLAERMNSWLLQQFYNYLKFNEQADVRAFTAKLPAFAEKYAWPQTEPQGFKYIPRLQPVKDIYLRSAHIKNDIAKRGNILHVRALTWVGLFLLIMAILNFVGLSTAHAQRRSKEVGVRKISGAYRGQLIGQFLFEAVLLSLFAVVLATLLTWLLLPSLNAFSGITLTFSPLIPAWNIPFLLVFGATVGVLAGIYPASILSAFRPARILQGVGAKKGRHKQWLNRGLVFIQFGLSVLIFVGAGTVYQQVRYLQTKDLGFNPEHLLYFRLRENLLEDYEGLKEELLKHSRIEAVSTAFTFPGDVSSGNNIIVPGKEKKNYPVFLCSVDHDFVNTLELEIIQGRDFSEAMPTDEAEAFILNETAVKALGFGTPEAAVGHPLHWQHWSRKDIYKKGRVIGVVKDYHFKSLHNEIGPVVLHLFPDLYRNMAVRIEGSDIPETLDYIEQTWDAYQTGYPLDYRFVADAFLQMYGTEEKLSTLLMIFTALAIFTACLGLLGLVSYATGRRIKEISIRKVYGASVGHILSLLVKDFLKIIFLAMAIAMPAGWYLLHNWLEEFPYHIQPQPWIFILAGGVAVVITLFTVIFRSLKAALVNPVESLRYE